MMLDAMPASDEYERVDYIIVSLQRSTEIIIGVTNE